MTVAELCQESHETAVEKGWWETKRGVPEMIALMHSELSEALEEYRNGTEERVTNGKPEGFGTELADCVIRIAGACASLGIDLQALLRAKMDYNKSRPYRHGGKAA